MELYQKVKVQRLKDFLLIVLDTIMVKIIYQLLFHMMIIMEL